MSQVATLITESQVVTSPIDEPLYEFVGGLRVEKPPMGNFQILLGSILMRKLAPYAHDNRLGRVVSEMLFKINPTGSPQRRPDVAFVSYARWPRDRKLDSTDGWEVIPDLAIEVISRSNSAEEMMGKVVEYFEVGVLVVWAVYPKTRQVYVYRSPKQVTILGLGDDLDGEDLLPGFRLSLIELFEDGE